MTTATLLLLALPLAGADASPAAGTQLVYRGQMTPVKDDGIATKKEFELTAVVLSAGQGSGAGVDLAWTLAETGRGGWTWFARFGRWGSDPRKRDEGSAGPALLYERAEGKSTVPLPQVLFARDEPLERGQTWSEGRLDYRVAGETRKAGRDCWEIDVRSPYGHKRTIWREKGAALVVAVRETVFIGQGDQHELRLELAEAELLAPDGLARSEAALTHAIGLREMLAVEPRPQRAQLSDEQLAKLRDRLPAFTSAAAQTPLAAIAKAAEQDTQAQRGRAGAMAALRDVIVGKPLGPIKLEDVAGKTLTEADLAGKVTVLHFWEYRDTPLEEPYGQVGYLDFLLRSRGAAGVQVLGVNVDERLADADTRRSSIAAARRLKAFMNLSYSVLLDDGQLLKRLGDPRAAGGKLPLFVVIDKRGNVVEYHAGLYDFRPDRGLFELDAIVAKALEK